MTKRPNRPTPPASGTSRRLGRAEAAAWYAVSHPEPVRSVRRPLAGVRARRHRADESDEDETAAFIAGPGNLESVRAGQAAARAGDVVPASVVRAELVARLERRGGPAT